MSLSGGFVLAFLAAANFVLWLLGPTAGGGNMGDNMAAAIPVFVIGLPVGGIGAVAGSCICVRYFGRLTGQERVLESWAYFVVLVLPALALCLVPALMTDNSSLSPPGLLVAPFFAYLAARWLVMSKASRTAQITSAS